MYVDRSLQGDPKKYKLIDELNFKNCMCFKIKTTRNCFVGITVKRRKFIIHAEYLDSNNIFSRKFLQNLKHRPNVVQDLSKLMKKALKKERFYKSVKQQIHQIQRTTGGDSKTKYRGWTHAKNEVLLEPGWISDAFEFCEPEFYKLVTMVTCDDYRQNFYTVSVGQCNNKQHLKIQNVRRNIRVN